jgi:hypothetical protein
LCLRSLTSIRRTKKLIKKGGGACLRLFLCPRPLASIQRTELANEASMHSEALAVEEQKCAKKAKILEEQVRVKEVYVYIHTYYVLTKPPMPIHYVLAAVFASCFYVLKSLLHE